MENPNTEIFEKLNLWKEASNAYYNEEPIMSDPQFDALTDELHELSDTCPSELKSEILSTLNKIQTIDGLKNVAEVTSEMVSLKKFKYKAIPTIMEAIKFMKSDVNRTDLDIYYGLKFDGMAIKVKIHDNKKVILTRGGQDVTDLLITHKDIVNINRPITHGELVIKKSVFNQKYSDEYENPRNCILGVLKQNPDDLDFIECTDGVNPLECNVWNLLNNDNIKTLVNTYFDAKEKFEYQIDGIVLAIKTNKQTIKDNYPLNIVSIKFKASSVQTEIVDIEWTQKKSGNLTPVYLVRPVKLDGSTITKVTGYNYASMKLSHCGIGAIIEITKSGDIIPMVEKVIKRSDNFKLPTIDYTIRGKHLVADNLEISKIYKFVLGLKILNLDGIGPVIAENVGAIVDYDIIELFNKQHKPMIVGAIGGGAVWNNFSQIYSITNIGLDSLIEMLQFDRCGKTLSRKFAEIILKINLDTKGIDKELLLNVCRGDGFERIKNAQLKLRSYGVAVTRPISINDDVITFEMTGNPPGMTKAEFVAKIKSILPNSVSTALTKDTKLLVCDDVNGTSGKLNKARKYNIRIMSYNDVLAGKY